MSRKNRITNDDWVRIGMEMAGMSAESDRPGIAPAQVSSNYESLGINDLVNASMTLAGCQVTDQTELAARLGLVLDITDDMRTFYRQFGFLTHPKTKKPVADLAWYQYQFLNDMKLSKYRLYLKSQKLGITTVAIMEDFYHAITDCKGMEILLVGQTKEKAVGHLQELRRLLHESPVFAPYLIEDPKSIEGLLPGNKSKSDTLYIHNPDNLKQPTKIIALGITSIGSLISFMRVGHIHMSDVSISEQLDEKATMAFGGLFSRLANSEGSMVLETPPRGPSGPIWDLLSSVELKQGRMVRVVDDPIYVEENGFLVRRLTYQHGIKAGLITKEFIEQERKKLGVTFGMYYETDFYSSDNAWLRPAQIKMTDVEAAHLANEIVPRCRVAGTPQARKNKPEPTEEEKAKKEEQKRQREKRKMQRELERFSGEIDGLNEEEEE